MRKLIVCLWVCGLVAVVPAKAATATPIPPKPGDANRDGVVNNADFLIWLAHYNQTTTLGSDAGDFNGDTKVNGLDYAIWYINFTPATTITPTPSGGLTAFVGAEGSGARSIGGRGGKVFTVNTLLDSTNSSCQANNNTTTCSLRDCMQASGARTCVFNVSGYINLTSTLTATNPFLTIAGQTAPGGGITLRVPDADRYTNHKLAIHTHDVVIRYLRSRLGTSANDSQALEIDTANAYNIIVDHSSFSWVGDETVIAWGDSNHITFQWNNISESLPMKDSAISDYADGVKGPLFGNDAPGSTVNGSVSLHHNLIAHHDQRCPMIKNLAGAVDVVNNIFYNLGNYCYIHNMGNANANLVGNFVSAGPNGVIDHFVAYDDPTTSGIYYTGNTIDSRWSSLKTIAPSSLQSQPTPFSVPVVTTSSAAQAYEDVLGQVGGMTGAGAVSGLNCTGTWYERRDPVDVRIIKSVRDGTRGHSLVPSQTYSGWGYIWRPEDVGGWPALATGTPCADSDSDGMPNTWETNFGLNPNSNDGAADNDGDGYTNLEEFINGTSPVSLITDPNAVFTIPSLPKQPYLATFTDPTFHTHLTRINGDIGTPTGLGINWPADARHHYQKDQPWSRDGKYIALDNKGSDPIILDGNTYLPLKQCPAGDDRWNPNSAFAHERIDVNNGVIDFRNIDTCTIRKSIANLPITISSSDGFGHGEGNPSFDGKFAVLENASQMFAVNLETGQKGTPIDISNCGLTSGCTVDWASVSPSGNFAVVSYNPDTLRVFDLNTSTLVLTPRVEPSSAIVCGSGQTPAAGYVYNLGHADMTLNPYSANDDVIVGQIRGWCPSIVNGVTLGQVVMTRLRDGQVTTLTLSGNEVQAHHISTRSYDRPGWAYVTYYTGSGKRFSNEVMAVSLDGLQRVERYAHTHSTAAPYRNEEHGVPSPDGRRIIFASAWDANCDSGCGANTNPQDYVIDTR